MVLYRFLTKEALLISKRGSVGDQKRLFWRVKGPLSATSVAKLYGIVGCLGENELQVSANQRLVSLVWDVGFLFENPRRQENEKQRSCQFNILMNSRNFNRDYESV